MYRKNVIICVVLGAARMICLLFLVPSSLHALWVDLSLLIFPTFCLGRQRARQYPLSTYALLCQCLVDVEYFIDYDLKLKSLIEY